MPHRLTQQAEVLSDRWISDNLATLRLPDDPQKAAELLQRIIYICELMLQQVKL